MKSDTDEILPILPVTPVYVLYPQRFYVLFVFSFFAFNQCIIWLTFSPVARGAETYYNISESTIDLLLNWGPIIFVPCLPLTYILLNKHHGLRHCMIILAVVNFISAFVRVIPSVITDPSSPHFSSIAMPFLHAGQILNAACGPLVMAPVSQLSCLWFAPHERTRATTFAIIAGNFGSTVGFLISPVIVSSPDRIPYLLYLHLALAFIACVLALLYFPAQPPTPPSAAAELLMLNSSSEKSNHSWKTYKRDVWLCFTNPAFVLLSTAGGLVSGAFSAWTGLYDLILKPENYTELQAGWFGFGSSLASIIGGLTVSYIADMRRFQHSLKMLIAVSLTGYLLATIWFELSVQTFFYDAPILSSTATTIGLSTALAGLFFGAASPLLYEALAEIMFPLPESLSASILVQWNNIAALILLFIAPNRDKLMNLLVLISIVVGILMVAFTRFSYKRRDEDERKRLEKEQKLICDHSHLTLPGYGSINETVNAALA